MLIDPTPGVRLTGSSINWDTRSPSSTVDRVPSALVRAPTIRIELVDRETLTPRCCTTSGNCEVTSCSLFCTCTCAMSASTLSSKVREIDADPAVEFEVM